MSNKSVAFWPLRSFKDTRSESKPATCWHRPRNLSFVTPPVAMSSCEGISFELWIFLLNRGVCSKLNSGAPTTYGYRITLRLLVKCKSALFANNCFGFYNSSSMHKFVTTIHCIYATVECSVEQQQRAALHKVATRFSYNLLVHRGISFGFTQTLGGGGGGWRPKCSSMLHSSCAVKQLIAAAFRELFTVRLLQFHSSLIKIRLPRYYDSLYHYIFM